jgi:hypothetical protein
MVEPQALLLPAERAATWAKRKIDRTRLTHAQHATAHLQKRAGLVVGGSDSAAEDLFSPDSLQRCI